MRIRIAPGAVLLLLAMALTQGALFFAVLLAAAIHESGHLLAAWALGIPLRALELDLPGAKLVTAGAIRSYGAEGVLAGAGPAASFLLFAFTVPHVSPFWLTVSAVTLLFALFNLLPIKGFDGGRVLFCLLASTAACASSRFFIARS